MPISVSCRCGKAFAANDNLAGKTVKCPACQQPLTIPAAGQPGAAAPRPAAAQASQPTADGKIVVACACGARFAAGAELAGKRVKCPKCGQALTVGGGQPAKPQAAAPAATRTTAAGAAGNPASATASSGLGGDYALASLLDEAGVKQRASGENACPSCNEFMAPEALLCIHCGYDRKSKKKLATQTIKKVEAKKLGPPNEAAKAGAAKAAAKAAAQPLNPYASPAAQAASAGSYSSGAELTAMDWLFVIFCHNIALIVAIIYLCTGNPKGKPLLVAWAIVAAISFGLGIVIGLVLAVMGAAAGGGGF
jgi:hypothetical protein